jgi:hypothetical protein
MKSIHHPGYNHIIARIPEPWENEGEGVVTVECSACGEMVVLQGIAPLGKRYGFWLAVVRFAKRHRHCHEQWHRAIGSGAHE